MQTILENFSHQFSFEPKIINGPIKKYSRFVLLGMGGSHLAADILKGYDPSLDLTVHSDYGLPFISSKEKDEALVIASSFSGNTEEVLEGLNKALREKLSVAILAKGGQLIEIAKKKKLPYIQFPDEDLQPRLALGYSIRGLLTLLQHKKGLAESGLLTKKLKSMNAQRTASVLVKKIAVSVPVIYTSSRNRAIGYNWKIKLNETGKIPAFCNVLPELNHNEMNGFDVQSQNQELSSKFHFIFLIDPEDHPSIKKRFAILERLYKKRKLPITVIKLTGSGYFEKVFNSLLVADWLSLKIAHHYKTEAEQVPMVEEFKKLMNS